MTWREGVVTDELDGWKGCDRYRVAIGTREVTALGYRDIIGKLRVGERVWLNCGALERKLGTGGFAFIIAPIAARPTVAPSGHIVKARYTPQQVMVGCVEDEESPHHQLFHNPAPLDDLPVVIADLHSALPAVIAGIMHAQPDANIAYVMTDGAALPLAFSRTVSQLRTKGLIGATITCGQAFGGDFESTSLINALVCAKRVAHADIAVVCQGPGNIGTGSTYGFSGLDNLWHATQAAMIGAPTWLVVRASSADRRARHFGLSHHTMRVLEHLSVPVTIALATDTVTTSSDVFNQLAAIAGSHEVVLVDEDFTQPLADFPVRLSTMGRSLSEDPLGFHIAAATGFHAASTLAH